MSQASINTIKTLVKNQGWHLAPMHTGEITRDKKTFKKKHPPFIGGWLDKAITKKLEADKIDSERPYLVCTGEESNLIALDCDNTVTADIIRAIDPDNPWEIKPLDKPGITLLYQYDEELHQSFATKQAPIELDFLSTGRGMFLPSAANKTKQAWEEVPSEELPVISSTLKDYLLNVLSAPRAVEEVPQKDFTSLNTYPALEPIINEAVESGKLHIPLLRLLTTHKARGEYSRAFNEQGYVGPKDIKKGGGSIYLLGISTIIGGDESISANLYTKMMNLLNDSLPSPLDEKRLDATIINPMLNKKSSVNGEVIWKYNKDWKAGGLTLLDKNNNLLYVLMDSLSYSPVIINMSEQRVTRESKAAECAATLRAITGDPIKPQLVEQRASLTKVVTDFTRGFGTDQGASKEFNIFQESECLSIIRDPQVFIDKYKNTRAPQEPTTTLAFLEHLIPKEEHREFFISFIKTKLTSFKPSPIIINFTGAPGSGKDTMFRWMQSMVNEIYTAKPPVDQMLDKYNVWMEDKMFVLCNEYPDSLKPSQYSEMKGVLKDISGSSTFSCRDMRSSPRPAKHLVTIITAQNFSAPLADAGDRRHFYVKTPISLDRWTGLRKYETAPGAGDMLTEFNRQLFAELPAFAFYLATKVSMLTDSEYMKAPIQQGANKFEQIDDKTARLAFVLQSRDWEYLLDILDSLEYEITDLELDALEKGKLGLDLCKAILNYWGYSCTTNHLNMAMMGVGIDKSKQYKVSQRRLVCFNVPDLDQMDLGVLDKTDFIPADDEEDEFVYKG